MSPRRFRVLLDGEVYEVEVELGQTDISLTSLIRRLATASISKVEPVIKAPSLSLKRESRGPRLTSPTIGRVVRVCVESGQRVAKGDLVIVIESMKSEVEIRSDRDGVVSAVLVKEGDVIRRGDPIIVFSE